MPDSTQARTQLREAVANLRVWRRGSERAVHKPLLTLMLIARAARRDAGVLSFEEVDKPLTRLLREFGPPRKSVHPEFPFWHLRSDGFWIVREAEGVPMKRGGSSPTRKTLLDHAVTGHVREELWTVLVRDAALRMELARHLLEENWPHSLHAAILDAVGLDLSEAQKGSRKRRDPAFRQHVLTAYERRCGICEYDGRLEGDDLALDAAHIRWHSHDGPDEVRNGVLLCSFHHVAFDRGAVGLADDTRILVSKQVSGGSAVDDWLSRFHGQNLRAPRDPDDRPDIDFLRWHRSEVFREPARALPA